MSSKVLITGATSGFGIHLSRAFLDKGFSLVAHGTEMKKLTALKAAFAKKSADKIEVLAADMRSDEGLRTLKRRIASGDIRVLVNNAGINPELRGDPVNRDDIFRINATAPTELSVEFFKHCGKHGGAVFNINSVAGLRGSAHEPLYAASKSALREFSESVKDAWLKKGVRVIDVYSGALAAGMSSGRSDFSSLIDPKELAEFLASIIDTKSFFVRDISLQKTARAKGKK